MSDLTIKFVNDDAREHFVDWLQGQGVDDYHIWMDAREYEGRETPEKLASMYGGRKIASRTGPITVLKFITNKKDPSVIKTKCGRMDE